MRLVLRKGSILFGKVIPLIDHHTPMTEILKTWEKVGGRNSSNTAPAFAWSGPKIVSIASSAGLGTKTRMSVTGFNVGEDDN